MRCEHETLDKFQYRSQTTMIAANTRCIILSTTYHPLCWFPGSCKSACSLCKHALHPNRHFQWSHLERSSVGPQGLYPHNTLSTGADTQNSDSHATPCGWIFLDGWSYRRTIPWLNTATGWACARATERLRLQSQAVHVVSWDLQDSVTDETERPSTPNTRDHYFLALTVASPLTRFQTCV